MGNPARNTEHLVPWKPGQSGNPAGRPRGARANQPAAYLASIVSLLPKQQEKIESPFADLSEDELNLLEAFLKSTRAKNVTPTIDAVATSSTQESSSHEP